jgi:hypothetical protein
MRAGFDGLAGRRIEPAAGEKCIRPLEVWVHAQWATLGIEARLLLTPE